MTFRDAQIASEGGRIFFSHEDSKFVDSSTPLNQTSHASTLPPPPPLEGSIRISRAINSFDHEKNSNPENYCTSPSIFSSDSMMSIDDAQSGRS
uniref:Uncharacterized protein n=1 Tax=Nelumbo nucifera TaxID=4432 RepID=A0A822Z2S2_NELNU|nr:TPA_asm: hypothetical protein HUJ06_015037 [Nelumbo nucifera]